MYLYICSTFNSASSNCSRWVASPCILLLSIKQRVITHYTQFCENGEQPRIWFVKLSMPSNGWDETHDPFRFSCFLNRRNRWCFRWQCKLTRGGRLWVFGWSQCVNTLPVVTTATAAMCRQHHHGCVAFCLSLPQCLRPTLHTYVLVVVRVTCLLVFVTVLLSFTVLF